MRAPSILEILEPTVGPSSSHTLGPLLAARDFVRALGKGDLEGDRIRVTLYGSVREQVDRAAETALEHFLGLACDPVGGVVQIPCIKRNAAGVVSALNAASLGMLSGGRDRVSLDATLDAMREIGPDMPDRHRETSRGGLAALSDLDGDGVPDRR